MYHYALKAHTYTFSHGNYKFDLTFIMIVYILNYIHMYYIYLIHVHVACIKKNADTNIKTLFKNLYSTTQVAGTACSITS